MNSMPKRVKFVAPIPFHYNVDPQTGIWNNQFVKESKNWESGDLDVIKMVKFFASNWNEVDLSMSTKEKELNTMVIKSRENYSMIQRIFVEKPSRFSMKVKNNELYISMRSGSGYEKLPNIVNYFNMYKYHKAKDLSKWIGKGGDEIVSGIEEFMKCKTTTVTVQRSQGTEGEDFFTPRKTLSINEELLFEETDNAKEEKEYDQGDIFNSSKEVLCDISEEEEKERRGQGWKKENIVVIGYCEWEVLPEKKKVVRSPPPPAINTEDNEAEEETEDLESPTTSQPDDSVENEDSDSDSDSEEEEEEGEVILAEDSDDPSLFGEKFPLTNINCKICYMNSALQFLFHVREFRDYLKKHSSSSSNLINTLYDLARYPYQHFQTEFIKEFKRSKQYIEGKQDDSARFLSSLLGMLPFHGMFTFKYTYEYICPSCGHREDMSDEDHVVDGFIREVHYKSEFEGSVRKVFDVDGMECEKCKCSEKGKIVDEIVELPQYFIIHLEKGKDLKAAVDIPESLKLRNSTSKKVLEYDIHAIIVHESFSSLFAHYYTYVRNWDDFYENDSVGSWTLFDDAKPPRDVGDEVVRSMFLKPSEKQTARRRVLVAVYRCRPDMWRKKEEESDDDEEEVEQLLDEEQEEVVEVKKKNTNKLMLLGKFTFFNPGDKYSQNLKVYENMLKIDFKMGERLLKYDDILALEKSSSSEYDKRAPRYEMILNDSVIVFHILLDDIDINAFDDIVALYHAKKRGELGIVQKKRIDLEKSLLLQSTSEAFKGMEECKLYVTKK